KSDLTGFKLKNEIINYLKNLIKLMEEIHIEKLEAKRIQLQSKIDYCEYKINEVVYELYNIEKHEIDIIESL
ncbi:MAG: hypothetical protein SGJ10_07130, partial [Bacteroidota bacterium]|nr:hypothetical protein [Bacteroidota bacterium]